MSAEDRQAIDERKELIESRARMLAETAIAAGEAWTWRLGGRPGYARDHNRSVDAAMTVAAYRDRYKVTSHLPVGAGADSDAQRADRQRALRAVRDAAATGVIDGGAVPVPSSAQVVSAP